MKRLLGLIVWLSVAGVVLTSALALAQTQKAAESPDAGAPFKPAPRPKRDLDYYIDMNDRIYRHCLLAEYHFIAKVSNLTREQAKAVAREGEKSLQEVILETAEAMEKAAAAGESVSSRDERRVCKVIRDKLTTIAKSHITAEQADLLQIELAHRASRMRNASIEAALVMIDKELFLSDEQYDEIRRSLDSNWQESWLPAPDLLMFSRPQLPAIPDEYVAKFLTEKQKDAWKDFPKNPHAKSVTRPPSSHFPLRTNTALEDDALREAREAELRIREDVKRRKANEAAK